MAQLESAANLDKLTDRRWRLLFPLLMETGLRINDALHLPQDCVMHDQHNAPYLRYLNRKMKREALVPISVEMAAMINEQAPAGPQPILAESGVVSPADNEHRRQHPRQHGPRTGPRSKPGSPSAESSTRPVHPARSRRTNSAIPWALD